MILPRYPVYIPSKGRADQQLTAKCLMRDGVPFHVVVEPQEHDEYAAVVGDERVLVLPFSNLGQGSIPARNWIKAHSIEAGAKRHWQIDDNIRTARKWHGGKRIPCRAGLALAACEDMADRYENVAIAGLSYTMFNVANKYTIPPFYLNQHVYSCTLVLNSVPMHWRGRYNEDTDLCLQALSLGWCTILLNTFMVDKVASMVMGGGNTAELYKGDGRLAMARALERLWPGVVRTGRRFRRPQHIVHDDWRKFDTQLIPAANPPPAREYNIRMTKVAEPKSGRMRDLLAEEQDNQPEEL